MDNRDDGIAIIWVVLAAAFIAGLSTVLIFRATSNSDQQLAERRFDTALFVADSGLNAALEQLYLDPDFFNAPTDPAFADESDEKNWVLGEIANMDALGTLDLEPVEGGEYAYVRPEDSEVVYAVGFSPSYGDPDVSSRVIKVDYTPDIDNTYVFLPNFGIASGGAVTVGGNGVGGIKGGAHSNEDLVKGNSKTEITGCTSATGDNDFEPDNPSECGPGEGVTEEIPDVIPKEFHGLSTIDLCIEGGSTVIREGGALSGKPGKPCTGSQLGVSAASLGWTRTGRLWTYNGGSTASEVFYIAGGSASMKGDSPPGGITVIVDAWDTTMCATKGGDLAISGNIQLRPHTSAKDLMFVIGRDLSMGGTSDVFGIMLAHEQFDIGGNPGANNAVIAWGECDTPGSPEPTSQIRGSGKITYNGGLEAPLYGGQTATGLVIIDRWDEIQ